MKEICERYGLPYNTGPFSKQWGIGPADDHPARLPGRQDAAEGAALQGAGGAEWNGGDGNGQAARPIAPSGCLAAFP